MSSVLAAALELADAGISVIPVRADGTKAPAVSWKAYSAHAADVVQLVEWFDNAHQGVGIVCGAVSGNLEMVELEGRAVDRLSEIAEIADASGLADLWATINAGWTERSPSGGWHAFYRVDGPAKGNTKLARQADHTTLAETRGEGGFVVVAPTPGSHHPSGKPWERLAGGPTTIPVLSIEQRDTLHDLVRMLDELPATEEAAPLDAANQWLQQGDARPREGGISPGDDYEARTDWDQILKPHGWSHILTRGRVRYWRRPGKNIGVSATTGHAADRDRLYAFTSSTAFEPEKPYTKFGAYAVLAHEGNHSAAAKALAAEGFGQRPEQPRPAPPAPPANTNTTAIVVDEPTTYTETDDGNALRLVDTFGDRVRYCPQRSLWLIWDGHRWRWDEAELVREHARNIARSLPLEPKTHRKASLSARGIDSMVRLARSDQRVSVHLANLDARPYELNTPAGVVDLRTGTLAAPDSTSLHTRSTAVAPDFDTTPTRWLDFLADTFAGDPVLTTYVQRLLGVSLVGTVLEQVLPFGFGSGANGKSTLLGTVQRIVGRGQDGYSISAPADMLTVRRHEEHSAQIAQLSGVRLVVTSELEEGERFAEAKVKMLTGGDGINARFMRENPFTFTPTHSLWLHANHQPAVRAGGPAFWRRLRLLPFVHTVPPEKRVSDLEDRLVDDEGPAILAWLIQGATDYFAQGLAEPESVRAATDAYAVDQDSVGRFVEEMCSVGDANQIGMSVPVAQLRTAYESWCRVEGEAPVSAKALTTALKSRFSVASDRDKHTRRYAGIRLVDVSSEDDPFAPKEPEQGEWYR